MSLVYPTAASIAEFAELVAHFDLLSKFLPAIDDEWAKVIEGDFSLCQMHPDGQNLPKAAARLFYRVIKIIILLMEIKDQLLSHYTNFFTGIIRICI